MTLRQRKTAPKKPKKKIESAVPKKVEETQAKQQLEELLYLVANSLDMNLERGFAGGVMIKKGGELSDYVLALGLGLEMGDTTDQRAQEHLIEHTKRQKSKTAVLKKMKKLFTKLAAGKRTTRSDRYFSFKSAEKAEAASRLLRKHGFEVKRKEGSKGFEIVGLPPDLGRATKKLKKELVKSARVAYRENKDAAKSAKDRQRGRVTDELMAAVDRIELESKHAKRKKDAASVVLEIEKKTRDELDWEKLTAYLNDRQQVSAGTGADMVEQLLSDASQPEHWITIREILEARTDIAKELERRIKAAQTVAMTLSAPSFLVYQRLTQAGFSLTDSLFVASSCENYRSFHKRNKDACGRVDLSRFDLDQRLIIVHTLRAIDKTPGAELRKSFGKFYAHLDPMDLTALRVGSSSKPKDKAQYSSAGMLESDKLSRRDDPEYRRADDEAKQIVALAKPLEYKDMELLVSEGGELSTTRFVLAMMDLKSGTSTSYVASGPREMARFCAYIDKYYPGLETIVENHPEEGGRGEWEIHVVPRGTIDETGAQWAAANIGSWANRFDYGGKIGRVVDTLGRETISVTIPAGQTAPAWLSRLVDSRGENPTIRDPFRKGMARKGVDARLEFSVKTKTEYYRGKKRKVPVSYTYTVVLDGTRTRGALWAARTDVGLPKKKMAPELKPVDFGQPATAVARGKSKKTGDQLAQLRRDTEARKTKKKGTRKKKA